ncbi:MAG: 6-phosphogluconolactonase [Betaproteobacteria bacterium]
MNIIDASRLTVLHDPGAVARHVAAWLVEKLNTGTTSARAVCLSGGTTPRLLYQILAEPPYSNTMPWRHIHWFWCDERYVPATDARSNYNMVRHQLLARAPIPSENVHAIPTGYVTPTEAAGAYERTLKQFYGANVLDPARPLFDITLLGIGEDGHTASLFPGSAILQERSRWVAAVSDRAADVRITLTYPAIESSRDVAFLVTGATKRNIMRTILDGAQDPPAARLRPAGRVHAFVDRAVIGDVRP